MKKSVVALLATVWMAGAFHRAAAADPPADAKEGDAVAIDLIHGPKITRWATGNIYPLDEDLDGREGWVVVTLMVDPAGKPYNAMARESSGSPAFERAALAAVYSCTFEPAQLNGTPIDARFTFKLNSCG